MSMQNDSEKNKLDLPYHGNYRVEKRLLTSGETLEEVLHDVLAQMEYDTELFVTLLSSYPDRLTSVREANGENTNY